MARRTTNATIDHDFIRRWAEERGAKPTRVQGTGGRGDVGMIRLDFPGFSGEGKLVPITWREFFKKFDERELALLYQDVTARGQRSNFNKLVKRETVAIGERAPARRARPAARRTATARASATRSRRRPPSRAAKPRARTSTKAVARKRTARARKGAQRARSRAS